MRPGLPRIWIITKPDHPDGPIDPIRRALEGCPPGLVGVQLRAKSEVDRDLVPWGRDLRELTRASGSLLSLNRRSDVAEIVEADGVHLPETGLPPSEIASHFPSLSLIGVSRHDRAGLEAAASEGAAYAFLSPVFQVPGKARPIGVHGFREAIAGVGLPTFALGGIRPEDVKPLVAAGAAGVAVRRAIYDAEDPSEALQAFLRELDNCLPNSE
ncbi:MAG: thiamine phosphate synthase [Polyangiales bacterium]